MMDRKGLSDYLDRRVEFLVSRRQRGWISAAECDQKISALYVWAEGKVRQHGIDASLREEMVNRLASVGL